MKKFRLYLIDIDRHFLEQAYRYLSSTQDVEVIGYATDSAYALKQIQQTGPDCIVLGLAQKSCYGLALLRILRAAYRLGDGYVEPLTPGALDAAHRRCIRRLGLPRLTLHGLRHTMATQALRNGASMRALQMVLGHADYRTTAMIYAHPDMAMLRRVVDAAAVGMVY